MYKDVVVGWDAGECARDALALAQLLNSQGGALTAACVHAGAQSTSELPSRDQADQALRHATARSGRESLLTTAVEARSAIEGLRAVAATQADPLIVVGSSRHGPLGRVHTGGVGRTLVADGEHALALPPRGFHARARGCNQIAVVFDGAHQLPAVAMAADLAHSLGATLHVVCVVPRLAPWARNAGGDAGYTWDTVSRRHHAQYDELLAGALADVDPSPASTRLVDGETLPELLDDATQRADLLVTGPAATGTLERLIAGVTVGTLHSAQCPVLICGRTTQQAAGDSAERGTTRA